MKMMKKGFTLIELLVVITIIGILASIVLISFPDATKKAKDSRIISAISQARTSMVYSYGDNGDYSQFSTTLPPEMVTITKEVLNNGGTLNVVKNGDSSKACMYSALTAPSTPTWYCTDSTGVAGNTTSSPALAPYCLAATAICPPDLK